MSIRENLVRIKEILVSYIDLVKYDEDSIEYLIDTVDYLLQDKIPCTQNILSVILEDMMVASSYHKNRQLLEAISLFKEVIKETSCIVLE